LAALEEGTGRLGTELNTGEAGKGQYGNESNPEGGF
jgi:hypothetical protein